METRIFLLLNILLIPSICLCLVVEPTRTEAQKMCFSITLAENYPGEKRERFEAVKDEEEIKTIILLSCFWGRPQHHPPAEVD